MAVAWSGTIEFRGSVEKFENASELSIEMIEIYKTWFCDNFGREPNKTEIENFFVYRSTGRRILLITVFDHNRKFPNNKNNWYIHKTVRIDGSDYYVQTWEIEDLAVLERKMRDKLGCVIHRKRDSSDPTDYAYTGTTFRKARKGYEVPCYPTTMPELVVFYKTTIKPEDRVLWLENDIKRDLFDILGFSTSLFSREEHIPVPAVILSDEFKTSTVELNLNSPLSRLRDWVNNRNYDQDKKPTRKMHIWGDYDEERNLITIYYKTIMNDCNSEKDFRDSVRLMLAHEFFHAFHYFTKPSIKTWTDEYKSNRVKEALAEFFTLLWGIRKDKNVKALLNKRFDSWIRMMDYDWPYSYTLFFFGHGPIKFSENYKDYVSCGGINKFMDVYNAANECDAFDILLTY